MQFGHPDTFCNYKEVEMAVRGRLRKVRFRFIPRRNISTRAKIGQMHEFARGLRWKIMTLRVNKLSIFKVVTTLVNFYDLSNLTY
jgi:uncharacterized protein YkvS